MNNYEKLCGKNGELVEFRQKQVLLGAAEIIKEHCKRSPDEKCKECVFCQSNRGCILSKLPCKWELPKGKNGDIFIVGKVV